MVEFLMETDMKCAREKCHNECPPNKNGRGRKRKYCSRKCLDLSTYQRKRAYYIANATRWAFENYDTKLATNRRWFRKKYRTDPIFVEYRYLQILLQRADKPDAGPAYTARWRAKRKLIRKLKGQDNVR